MRCTRPGDNLAISRSALVTTVVACGAVLVLFAMPPRNFWATFVPLRRDRRAALLAVGIAILLALVVLIPPLRRFFDLTLLSAPAYAGIACVVVVWTLALRLISTYTEGIRPWQGETMVDQEA